MDFGVALRAAPGEKSSYLFTGVTVRDRNERSPFFIPLRATRLIPLPRLKLAKSTPVNEVRFIHALNSLYCRWPVREIVYFGYLFIYLRKNNKYLTSRTNCSVAGSPCLSSPE